MLIILIIGGASQTIANQCIKSHDAIIRGDTSQQELALVFTGGDYSDGGEFITKALNRFGIQAGFFFTGGFYRDSSNRDLIFDLIKAGHYLGPHSDQHLLYCSWENRDSLLVTRKEFKADLINNYRIMGRFGIEKSAASYFIPPYEWYNRKIVKWAKAMEVTVFNFTPGTLSHADYTTPRMKNYRSSEVIYSSIMTYEKEAENGLNGFILLIHIGSSPEREDKFYYYLDELIPALRRRGYKFVRIDKLLKTCN